MKFYFSIQFKRLHRHLKDFGVEPLIGYVLLVGAFYGASNRIFERLPYAPYIYMVFSLAIVFAIKTFFLKIDFLKLHYLKNYFRKLLISSHLIIAMPFVGFLVYKSFPIHAIVLFFAAFFFSFIPQAKEIQLVIPTPFYRRPFEFIIGFRKTFGYLLIAYAFLGIGLVVDNYNLSMAAIVIVFLVCAMYYMMADPHFYIWIHSLGPKDFLKHKITIAIRYSVLLTSPLLVILGFKDYTKFPIVLLFECFGIFFLSLSILIKYAFNKVGVSIIQSVILGVCFFFPPIMLFTIPYFYKKAINELKLLLS